MKGHLFWVLVLKGLVGLHRTVQLQLLQHIISISLNFEPALLGIFPIEKPVQAQVIHVRCSFQCSQQWETGNNPNVNQWRKSCLDYGSYTLWDINTMEPFSRMYRHEKGLRYIGYLGY